MLYHETPLAGAYVIEVERMQDERGFFARTWSFDEFAERGLDTRIAQCSVSFNPHAGTMRGMHFQAAPHEETKFVRCTRGRLFDVIIDLRSESATFRRWFGVELSAENGRQLYIPVGFAHGYLTLECDTEITYQISTPYHATSARGVRWNDPAFAIAWPAEPHVMSQRDRQYPDFDVAALTT
jgi:dTDP-4-dehydrorhamnose 3,5-epimerase